MTKYNNSLFSPQLAHSIIEVITKLPSKNWHVAYSTNEQSQTSNNYNFTVQQLRRCTETEGGKTGGYIAEKRS